MPGGNLISALEGLRKIDEPRHRAEFYRMWQTGAHAGLTHPRSLEIMGKRQFVRVEAAREWLLNGTRRGQSLTTLVGAGGDRFDDFERALLAFGEETGKLEDALRLLADYNTGKNAEILHVKKQLAYPFFLRDSSVLHCAFPFAVLRTSGRLRIEHDCCGDNGFAFRRRGGCGGSGEIRQEAGAGAARMARALALAVEAGLALPPELIRLFQLQKSPEISACCADWLICMRI